MAGPSYSAKALTQLVEVTADSGSTTKISLASQACRYLILAAVPEGWTAQVVPTVLPEQQLKTVGEINLNQGKSAGSRDENAPSASCGGT
jgi:hypothetical protein